MDVADQRLRAAEQAVDDLRPDTAITWLPAHPGCCPPSAALVQTATSAPIGNAGHDRCQVTDIATTMLSDGVIGGGRILL